MSMFASFIVASTPELARADLGEPDYDPVFYYYHSDHLGSPKVMTDRDGDPGMAAATSAISATISFNLFGEGAFDDQYLKKLDAAMGVGTPFFADPSGLCKDNYMQTHRDWIKAIKIASMEVLYNKLNSIFVDPYVSYFDYYVAFRDAGMGRFTSAAEAVNMRAGKVVGYSTLCEGYKGIDVRSQRLTHGLERASQIGIGGVQTVLSVVAGAEGLHALRTPKINPIRNLPRTGSALKKDSFHAFSNIIDNMASEATATQLKSGGTLYQVKGSFNGRAGRFEWIVYNDSVTHRMFVPGGRLNGVPIKP